MKPLKITLLSFFVIVGLTVCTISGFALDSMYLQHERAISRWDQRKPNHFSYIISIRSSFWHSKIKIEILDDSIQQNIDMRTGSPAVLREMVPGSYMHETGMLWDYLLIEPIFEQITAGRKPPKTFSAYLNRTNPQLYFYAASRGFLPYERTSCDPAFPRVRYNDYYGYPEELVLGGDPCTSVHDLTSPVSITIESFNNLP